MDDNKLASFLIGTTREDKSTYSCKTMSQKLSINSSTNYKKSNTNHIQVPQSPMEQRSSMPLQHPLHHSSIRGKLLFLGRAVDSTLLCPISAIASQSVTPTEETMRQTQQLLDYIAIKEEAVLTFNTSDMKLAAHSDASYLSEPKARSRAGGHFSYQAIPPYHKTTEHSSAYPTY